MKKRFLVDTDIFIDFLRGKKDAIAFMKHIFPEIYLSVISIGELYSGVREGQERRILEEALNSCQIIDVTENIAKTAGLFKRSFGKSHGVPLPDALIAATAQESCLTLATHNTKHFPMLAELIEPYR